MNDDPGGNHAARQRSTSEPLDDTMPGMENPHPDQAIPGPSRRRTLQALCGVAAGVLSSKGQAADPGEVFPLFDGMGPYAAGDASGSALARRHFAQGMVLAWGFNPEEAARSFRGALHHDPGSAAACWGWAWSLGPNINSDLAAAHVPQVDEALVRARALKPGAAPRWQGLIDALSARHPRPGTPEVDEEAYARQLRALADRWPRDADLATLAAEAVMNLHPYDWWDGQGRPHDWTREILQLLSRAMALQPDHPGALHDWVHVMELGPTPQRARPQAERLRTLVPGSGHLLHMPAHIDMRTGHYDRASAAGERAIAADLRYLQQVDAQGAYRVGYVAHNHHFLWASASMEGRSARALEAAQAAYPAACGPRPGDRSSGTLQHFEVLPLYALVRFGRWQEILTGTRPPDGPQPYPLAVWHYARGTAWARTGRLPQAEAELARLAQVSQDPALTRARVKTVHAAASLVAIAQSTLQADLALARGRTAQALELLRRAVAQEDALATDEPHLWLAPTRQALGAALLEAGRPAQAVQVFLEDLRHYPDNGWSLRGLAMAQRAQGLAQAAQATEARQRRAWRAADLPLPRPRF